MQGIIEERCCRLPAVPALGLGSNAQQMDVAVPGINVAVVLEEIAELIELWLDDLSASDDLFVLVGGVGLVLGDHAVVDDFESITSGIIREGLGGCKVLSSWFFVLG